MPNSTRYLCSNSRGEHYIKHETITMLQHYKCTMNNGEHFMVLAEDEHDAAQQGVEECIINQMSLSDVELIDD